MNKLFLVILFSVVIVSVGAFALAITPSAVTGNVTWSNGTAASGADVSVICEHNGINSSVQSTSLSDGSYNAEFNSADCNYNDKVWVMASIGGMTGFNFGNMCDEVECFIPVAILDIQIPEFGLLGIMFIVLAGVGIVAFIRR